MRLLVLVAAHAPRDSLSVALPTYRTGRSPASATQDLARAAAEAEAATVLASEAQRALLEAETSWGAKERGWWSRVSDPAEPLEPLGPAGPRPFASGGGYSSLAALLALCAGLIMYVAYSVPAPVGPAERMSPTTVFIFHRLVQCLTTAEYGIFPAASITIRQELSMSELQLGLIGTLTYAGIVLGSLVSPLLFSKFGPMRCCRMAMLLSAAATVLTVFAPSNETLLAARCLAGFAHAPLYVYFLVWIDTFAPPGVETRWMGMYALVGALSNLASYSLTAYVVYGMGLTWRWSFSYPAVLVLLLALMAGRIHPDLWECEAPTGLNFGPVLAKPTFWLLTMCVALQWYVLSGVEYFGVSFLHKLGASESYAAELYIGAGIGIAIGIGLGSILADKLGGYDKRPNSLLLAIGMTVFPLPALPFLVKAVDATSAMVMATVYLAAYASINPLIIGLALRIVPENKTQASAVLNFVSTGLGFMVGPAAAGAVAQAHGLRAAWSATFLPGSVIPPLLCAVALYERVYGPPPVLKEALAKLGDSALKDEESNKAGPGQVEQGTGHNPQE